MNSEIPQALYENVVEHLVMTYVKGLRPEDLVPIMESEAMELLSQIKAVLDDESVEDPNCFFRIDAIVRAFGEKGIYTPRHDW